MFFEPLSLHLSLSFYSRRLKQASPCLFFLFFLFFIFTRFSFCPLYLIPIVEFPPLFDYLSSLLSFYVFPSSNKAFNEVYELRPTLLLCHDYPFV